MFSKVSYNGQSVRRIDALGNPDSSNGTPIAPNSDTNPNDLLHCFNLGFDTLITNSTYQNNCGSSVKGQYVGFGQVSSDTYQSQSGSTINLKTTAQNDAIVQQSLPNDSTIANIYCGAMGFSNDTTCISYLLSSGQVNNDLGHFEQYILDTNVMSNYMDLTRVN